VATEGTPRAAMGVTVTTTAAGAVMLLVKDVVLVVLD
jgi:hypothetical protein